VVNQLTDLPDDVEEIRTVADRNVRIRREGTGNLLHTTGVLAGPRRRFVVQSVAWELPGDGGVAAAQQERAVLAFGGVVVRYGQFYGPGTYFPDEVPPPPRIEITEAARRTVPALEAEPGTVLEVVKDR
jgi:hypothetical protein